MNPICWLSRRQISMLALQNAGLSANSRLARHLEVCRSCQNAAREYQILAGVLDRIAPIPAPSDDFLQSAWARLDKSRPASRNPTWAMLAIGAGATAVVLAILVLHDRPRPIEPAREQASSASAGALKRIASAGASGHSEHKSPKHEKKLSAISSKRAAPSRSERMKRLHPRKQSVIMRVASTNGVPSRQPSATIVSKSSTAKAKSSPSWDQWAVYYESFGDYRSAATAYGLAAAAYQSPIMSFRAGKAAEQAGDVADAVAYYANLLKTNSEPKKQPEKGSRLWTHEQDSA